MIYGKWKSFCDLFDTVYKALKNCKPFTFCDDWKEVRVSKTTAHKGSIFYFVCNICRKTKISYPDQGVRNVSFLENFEYLLNE